MNETEIELRVEQLEAQMKRINDIERASVIVWRIILYVGAFAIGVTTFWSQIVDIFKKVPHP